MKKSSNFTIEVHGLDIPDQKREEISRALNQTFMQKLGELDFTSKDGGTTASAGGESTAASSEDGSLIFYKWRIDGGRLMKLLSQDLTKVIRQVEVQNNLGTERGNIAILQGNAIG